LIEAVATDRTDRHRSLGSELLPAPRAVTLLGKLTKSVEQLPGDEDDLIEEMLASPLVGKFVAEYRLKPASSHGLNK
jgi:hypothetical protein